MSNVLMLVINPMRSDSRVEKEAASLARAGFAVTVVGIWEPGLRHRETRDGFDIRRVPYRRAVKDAVVGRQRASRQEAAGRRHALELLVRALAPSGSLPLRAVLLPHRARLLLARAASRARWLVAAVMLKLLRSRILVTEYWRSIAVRLPRQLPRPDVIHAHDLGTLAAAVRLARSWERAVPGAPRPRVVYDSHELYVEQQTRWKLWEKWLWRLHERRWIRHADLVVTVSDGIADELRRRYGLRKRPLVLFNAPAASTDAAPHPDVRAALGLPSGAPIVVYVGAVKPGRGVEGVLEAMQDEIWHLALVGPGESPHVAGIAQRARELNVAERLHLLDPVPAHALPAHVRTADVGIHPLLPSCRNHELAMPNKLFDYLVAGLPMAVAALPEMGGFVRRNGLGVLFDPRRPDDIAAAIRRLLETQGERERIAAAARSLLGSYGWERQEARLLEAYGRLLRPSTTRPAQVDAA